MFCRHRDLWHPPLAQLTTVSFLGACHCFTNGVTFHQEPNCLTCVHCISAPTVRKPTDTVVQTPLPPPAVPGSSSASSSSSSSSMFSSSSAPISSAPTLLSSSAPVLFSTPLHTAPTLSSSCSASSSGSLHTLPETAFYTPSPPAPVTLFPTPSLLMNSSSLAPSSSAGTFLQPQQPAESTFVFQTPPGGMAAVGINTPGSGLSVGLVAGPEQAEKEKEPLSMSGVPLR